MKDYVKIADEYANRAIDPKYRKNFGIWIRLAAKRYLKDRIRAENPENSFYFDHWNACDPCDFAEKLPHVEGKWKTPNIVLHESHVFFLVQLFGFRKRDGSRRYSTALFAIARKNAKSTLASIIGLYCQNCEGENGPQVITAATTGVQARIVFNVAKAMVNKTPALREWFGVEAFANAIASFPNSGTFKPINAKASTQDGLNPSCVIIDEIHAHKNAELLTVLRSAAGARANVLFLYLTTEGIVSEGPWQEERKFAKLILRGALNEADTDHYLAIYYAIDEKDDELGTEHDDEFDESCWIKANPLLDVNPFLLQKIRESATEARNKPSEHAEFIIKRCNRPAGTASAWVNLSKWRECNRSVDLKMLRNVPCYAGLDLSSTTDLTSFRLVWELDDWLYTHAWRWVPKAQVRARRARGLVPYAGWVQAGLLIESGDSAIDYEPIKRKIVEVNETFNLQSVGYDSWNAIQIVNDLDAEGVTMKQVIQGPKSYHPALQRIENAYLTGKLAHGNDPVLNWNAANMVVRTDENMNMAPAKKRASEKIDDFCALGMAVVQLLADEQGLGGLLQAYKQGKAA